MRNTYFYLLQVNNKDIDQTAHPRIRAVWSASLLFISRKEFNDNLTCFIEIVNIIASICSCTGWSKHDMAPRLWYFFMLNSAERKMYHAHKC